MSAIHFLILRFIEVAGWAIVHSLWQGIVIAVALWLALACTTNSATRYRIACLAMTALVICPVATVIVREHARFDVRLGFEPASGPQTGFPMIAHPDTVENLERNVQSRLYWIVALWGAGVCVLTARTFSAWLALRRWRNDAPAPPEQQTLLRRLERAVGVRRMVQLLATGAAEAPVTFGYFRPVILLPFSVITGLSQNHLELILMHELFHIRRLDYLFALVQKAIETLVFYHPTTWWISRQVNVEREHCCDDFVAAACGDRFAYAHALLDLEELRSAPQITLAASAADLRRRVLRLVKPSVQHVPSSVISAGAITLACGLVVVALHAQLQRQLLVDNHYADSASKDVAQAANRILLRLRGSDWVRDEEVEKDLAQIQAANARTPLVDGLRHYNPATRQRMVWIVAQLQDKRGAEPLIERLQDPSMDVRRTAVWGLGYNGDNRAAPALIQCLNSGDPAVRFTAAWSLGFLRSEEAIGPLTLMLQQDPEVNGKRMASWALATIRGQIPEGYKK